MKKKIVVFIAVNVKKSLYRLTVYL